jgi:hypothetical protein
MIAKQSNFLKVKEAYYYVFHSYSIYLKTDKFQFMGSVKDYAQIGLQSLRE